jgi:hypothetical protein
VKTNELKKGDLIRLRNGWLGVIADNQKGNTRMATVHGHYTETGSVYSHDIVTKYTPVQSGERTIIVPVQRGPLKPGLYTETTIEHTPEQIKLKQRVESMGF